MGRGAPSSLVAAATLAWGKMKFNGSTESPLCSLALSGNPLRFNLHASFKGHGVSGGMGCAENGLFSHKKYMISTEIIPQEREVLMQYSLQRKRNLSEKKAESKLARGSATRLTSGN